MAVVQFDRDSKAKWYASQSFKVDPGARTIYYLPTEAPDREIRLVVVNDLMAEWAGAPLAPLDFGVDVGAEEEHKLFFLDVTPRQWKAISSGEIPLPKGWALEGAVAFDRRRGK